MNIISAQYVTVFGGSDNACIKTTIDGVEMWVPIDSGNRHYVEIMRQVDDGELTIEEAD